MNALDAITSRVSALKLVDPAPPPDVIAASLAAAANAPDHGRLKPWRFLLIEGAARLRFGDLLAQSLKARDPAATEEVLRRERDKALRAPLIIVVAAKISREARIPAIEQQYAAAAAAQNVFLALHTQSYGVMWKTGDAAYDPMVKQTLGLDTTDEIVGFMYVGTISVKGPERQPFQSDEFISRWTGPVAR